MKHGKYLLIILAIFYLNDFANIFVKNSATWLSIDYTTRAAVIFIVFILIKKGILAADYFVLKRLPFGELLLYSIVLIISGVAIDQFVWRFFEGILPHTGLGNWPGINNVYIKWFDLTVGIALVAVSEELAFRGYMVSFLKEKGFKNYAIVLAGSLVFGFAHWSIGLHAVISATVWAIPPLLFVLKKKSIYPVIAAHFVTDIISFSGALSKVVEPLFK